MPNGAPLCYVGQRDTSQPVRETYPDRHVQDGIKPQATFGLGQGCRIQACVGKIGREGGWESKVEACTAGLLVLL